MGPRLFFVVGPGGPCLRYVRRGAEAALFDKMSPVVTFD